MKTLKIGLLAALLATTATVTLAQTPPDGANGERAKKMHEHLKAADKNGDGLISREEATASLPRLAKHFDEIDTNKDGQISKEEMKAFHEKRKAARGTQTK